MLAGDWVYVAALAASFVIATLASPVGVSGAVLLLPFQVSVLGTPSPSVTPTNLLYNVVATPGALFRYWRQRQTGGPLTRTLLTGTIPGVVVGSIIRVKVVPGPRVFDAVIAFVLVPLGSWLLVSGGDAPTARRSTVVSEPWLILIAVVVGCVGGIYGIGGGSILAPILISFGRSPREVAPATLAATLVTSIAGIANVRGPLDQQRLRRSRLGRRTRARSRRTDRWLHRRSPTAPPSGGHDPAAARIPRARHRHPIRIARVVLTRTDCPLRLVLTSPIAHRSFDLRTAR